MVFVFTMQPCTGYLSSMYPNYGRCWSYYSLGIRCGESAHKLGVAMDQLRKIFFLNVAVEGQGAGGKMRPQRSSPRESCSPYGLRSLSPGGPVHGGRLLRSGLSSNPLNPSPGGPIHGGMPMRAGRNAHGKGIWPQPIDHSQLSAPVHKVTWKTDSSSEESPF